MSRRAASQPPELPGLEFVRLIGSGGFADVFLYQQQLPKRLVAVKVLLADELDQAARQAFVDEANVMAQLSAHPFIVTIFHADVAADGRPYLVMEYCSGPNLATRYKSRPLDVPDVLRTGIRLAGAIATAHQAGILHRDIKPANVLGNDFGWPALTDFGIASAIDDSIPVHTTTSSAAGMLDTGGTGSESIGMSVPWSPPEMFAERPQPDARSDVFSLAATLHTLLSGRTPFEIPGRSNGILDLIGRIERGARTPIPREDVPRSLQAVLAKAMASKRSERYASAVDFARALQRVELELGFAATSLEVPNLVDDPGPERGDDDADATSLRQMPVVQAQAPAPPRFTAPPPSAPSAPAAPSPATADETRVRAVPEVAPHATAQHPAPGAVPPPSQDAPPPPAGPADAPGSAGAVPLRKRSWFMTAVLLVPLLVITVGVVVAIRFGAGGDRAEPAPTESSSGGGSAIVEGTVPTPEFVEAAPEAGAVTFTWRNPDPEDGDSFRWWLAEQPDDVQRADTPSATVERPSAGARVCVEVVIVRAGRTSPIPMERCDPE